MDKILSKIPPMLLKELMNSKQFHIAKKEPKAKKKDNDDKKENN